MDELVQGLYDEPHTGARHASRVKSFPRKREREYDFGENNYINKEEFEAEKALAKGISN